jgi:hypothetical protein
MRIKLDPHNTVKKGGLINNVISDACAEPREFTERRGIRRRKVIDSGVILIHPRH